MQQGAAVWCVCVCVCVFVCVCVCVFQGSGLYFRGAVELVPSVSWRERHRTALLCPKSFGDADPGQLACKTQQNSSDLHMNTQTSPAGGLRTLLYICSYLILSLSEYYLIVRSVMDPGSRTELSSCQSVWGGSGLQPQTETGTKII